MSTRAIGISAAALVALLTIQSAAFAHCDGLDGPVVKAAQRALENGEIKEALIWVQKDAEVEVAAAFEKTLAVRTLSPQARELADRYFFETVVRLHRAGEGEPYTGLKPAGRDLGPAIPAADQAIESGSAEVVSRLLVESVEQGIAARLSEALRARKHAGADIDHGRAYVKAYVAFLHYVERVHAAASAGKAHGDAHNAVPAAGHAEH